MVNLKDALAAASETKELRIGWGILDQLVDIFVEQFRIRKQ